MSNPRGECLDLLVKEAAAGVGEALDLHGASLPGRVTNALRDALAALVMAELHICSERERWRGGER